jgi:hypothetical protein
MVLEEQGIICVQVIFFGFFMSIENQNYKLDILEYAANQHLDKLLSCSDKDALNVILNQSKDLIWKIATEIYNESGHKIDFAFIKNLLDQRSTLLKTRIGEEQRAKADLEARRLFKEAEKERLRAERERIKTITSIQTGKSRNY